MGRASSLLENASRLRCMLRGRDALGTGGTPAPLTERMRFLPPPVAYWMRNQSSRAGGKFDGKDLSWFWERRKIY
jgi:hypothetical protein